MEEAPATDEEKQCSNCKRFISAKAFVLHEAHCRRHLRLCPECQEPVPVQDMEEHHRENHAPQSCDQCGATMPADRLEEHLDSLCPERAVNCKYCELEVRSGDYDTHIETCGSRTDYCDRCNVRVMLKDMEEHKLTKCSDLRVTDDGLHPEPTLENLPPAYMDGFAGDGFTSGGTSQGALVGNGAAGVPFGGIGILGSFGMLPQFLEDGAILFGGHPPSRDNEQRQRREDNVELDQEWLQEVGGVCQGEDLDRMMAQAIALEANQQATAHDDLFGVDDRLLHEDHYANVVKDMEEERATNDEEMARRLQSTFDREYHMERTDKNLARQIGREEEETVGIPKSPPLTSVLPPGTTTPINAHHPQAPLTSHLPTVDYQTSIQRTRFSVPEGRERGDNDDDEEGEWRQEGESEEERVENMEREREREHLRERLREEEREEEQLRERLRREEERMRDQLRERLREHEREGEGEGKVEDNELLTGRLQIEERERRATDVESNMQRDGQNSGEATGGESGNRDAPGKIDDAELAYELQKKEIDEAKVAIKKKNEEFKAELEKKQMEIKNTELIIKLSKEDAEYHRRKLIEQQAKIERLRRQIEELSEKDRRRGYWSTGATPGHLDTNFYQRDRYDKSYYEDPPPPTPPNSPPTTPSPPPSPEPMSGSTADYVRQERNGDEDEPRLKPIPKQRPQDKDKIPCQFCHKSFSLDVIMSHQHHCRAGSGHGGRRAVGRGTVGGVRGVGRGRSVQVVNLGEVLREEQSHTRERGAVGEGNAVCRYCNEVYPRSFIDPHQVLCDKNPEKGLKNAYKSHLTSQDNKNLSALPLSRNPPPSDPQPPSLPSVPPNHEDTTTTEVEEWLPCEFCQKSCPPHKLLSHEAICLKKPKSRRRGEAHVGGVAPPTAAGSGEVAPCQYCDRPISLDMLIKHETVCRFQREPSLPPSVSPSVLPSSRPPPSSYASSPRHPPTSTASTTAPQTSDTHPSSSSSSSPTPSSNPVTTAGRVPQTHSSSSSTSSALSSHSRNIAAVFPSRNPPFVASPATPTSGLTDDEKASLTHSHNPTTTSSSLALSAQPAARQRAPGIQPAPRIHSGPMTTTQTTTSAQNRVTTVSSAHPVSLKSTGVYKPSRARGAAYYGGAGAQLPTTLPQIFMYNSASQPHSVRAGGSGERQRKAPVSGGGSQTGGHDVKAAENNFKAANGRDVKATETKFEVVGNSVTPQRRDVTSTTSGHSEVSDRSFTAVPTTTYQLEPVTKGFNSTYEGPTRNFTATSHADAATAAEVSTTSGGHSESKTTVIPTTSGGHSESDLPATSRHAALATTDAAHTAVSSNPGASSQNPQSTSTVYTTTSAAISSTVTAAPNTITSYSTPRPPTIAGGGPNHIHYQRPHVPLPPMSQPSPLIGTDTTIVRPTQSDFAALRRQHPGLVPTPIPMPSSLMTNPLKMLAASSSATEVSLLGNLHVIPPISSGPGSKKDLVKPSGNKTIYKNTHSNTGNNTQLLLNLEKGGVKTMDGTLTQRPMIGLDMEVPPIHLQNSHSVTPLTSNLLGDTYKGNLDTLPGRNQKFISMDRIGMEVMPTYPQQGTHLIPHRNLPTDTGKSLGTAIHGDADTGKSLGTVMHGDADTGKTLGTVIHSGGNELLLPVSSAGMELVSQQQQNLRNTLNANKLGLRMEPGILSEKMGLDLSSEASLFPMQEALNSRNITSLKDASLLKDMRLTKSPLKTKNIELDKLSKGKDKGGLDMIKIMGDPALTSNLSPEYAGSKLLGVSSSGNTFAVSNSPISSPIDNISPSSSLNSNSARLPASGHQPTDASPTSSIGSSSGFPANPPASIPSPTSPGNPPHFPASSTTSETSVDHDTKSPLSAGEDHSGREDGESGEVTEVSSESSSALASTGGPLVEYIDSYTYVDNNQQTTSLSSTCTTGEGEGEGEGEGSEEDEEMPELEEVPDDEVEAHNVNVTDSNRLLPPRNSANTITPGHSQPDTNAAPDPPSSSGPQQQQPPREGGGDTGIHLNKKTPGSSEGGVGSRRGGGGSWTKTPPPSNSSHTPRSPATARGSAVTKHSPATTAKPMSSRTGNTEQQQRRRAGSDGALHKRTRQPFSGAQNTRQQQGTGLTGSPSASRAQNTRQQKGTGLTGSPSAPGSGRQPRPIASLSRGKEQGASSISKHGSSKGVPPPHTKSSLATEGPPHRKPTPGPQYTKTQRK